MHTHMENVLFVRQKAQPCRAEVRPSCVNPGAYRPRSNRLIHAEVWCAINYIIMLRATPERAVIQITDIVFKAH